MGTIIAWIGAIFGGRITPRSSPCIAMTPPRSRSESPKVVWCTYLCSPLSSSYLMSYAREKLSLYWWIPPFWIALPVGMSESTATV